MASQEMRRSLAVSIVNWNGGDLILHCIRSVLAHVSGIKMDIVVVDNASSDGSPDRIGDEFPGARVIRNSENVGFARANNQILREVAADYVLLLNPDAVITPGSVERMVAFMEGHSRAGACSPLIVGEDGRPQWTPTRFPTVWGEVAYCATFLLPPLSWALRRWRGWKRGREWRSLANDGERGVRVDVLNGACLLARRTTLEEVGLLEERFFLFSEEADWCRRMDRAGWERYWVPRARVVHLVGKSRAQLPGGGGAVHFYRSRVTLFAIHRGPFQATLVRALYRLSFWWNALLAAAGTSLRPWRRSDSRRRVGYYLGLAAGLGSGEPSTDGDTRTPVLPRVEQVSK